MINVQCNKYNHFDYHCADCAHGKGHEPFSIRKSVSVALDCHQFGDYCCHAHQMVMCVEVVPTDSSTAGLQTYAEQHGLINDY